VTKSPDLSGTDRSPPALGQQGETFHPKLVEGEVRVVGHRWSPRVHEIKAFLARSRVPYRWFDVDRDEDSAGASEHIGSGEQRYPLVILPDGTTLVDPDVEELARRLGLDTEPDARHYDLVVVGGGPAGLAASIYGASEGLRTVVLEQEVPGGQISYSAIVENYPGFPEGLSGSDLANRTVQQADRFGVEITVLRRAVGLRQEGEYRVVTLDDGRELISRAVLLSLGVSFRWLEVPGCTALVGAGVYYGAAIAEASACRGQDIYILGGGNSAGQAALLLAQFARRVVILAPESSIEETMSQYLIDRLRKIPNVEIRTNSTVVGVDGEKRLEAITIREATTGSTEAVRCDGLFVFIGATPRTDWLEHTVRRDEKGFIVSGADVQCDLAQWPEWSLEREPFRLETSMPGVFVAGDVRRGSVKRLTAAVGEGAMALQYIHQYGKATKGARPPAAAGPQGSAAESLSGAKR
jgi:thioredoxin reductase (NADPH)